MKIRVSQVLMVKIITLFFGYKEKLDIRDQIVPYLSVSCI